MIAGAFILGAVLGGLAGAMLVMAILVYYE
jgi:hypothetical protein